MIEPRKQTWDAATFAGARHDLLLSSLRLTPAERFEWLEDAIDFAHRSGAARTTRDVGANARRPSVAAQNDDPAPVADRERGRGSR